MVVALLSINAAASDVYTFDDVEVGAVDLYVESPDLEYLSQAPALASSINPDFGVGTSNTAIFAGVARKLPFGVNYLYWRESRYEYCFAYSADLVLSGNTFRSDSIDIITYNTNSTYSEQATFTTSHVSNFSLSADSYLVWSNLGDYPSLEDGRDIFAETTLFVLAGYGIFYLLSRIVWRRFS